MQSKDTDTHNFALNTIKFTLLFSSMLTESAFKDSDSKLSSSQIHGNWLASFLIIFKDFFRYFCSCCLQTEKTSTLGVETSVLLSTDKITPCQIFDGGGVVSWSLVWLTKSQSQDFRVEAKPLILLMLSLT